MLRLISGIILLSSIVACSNPQPRGVANPGVTQTAPATAPNAPYYTGADPDFPRTGARSNKGGQ